MPALYVIPPLSAASLASRSANCERLAAASFSSLARSISLSVRSSHSLSWLGSSATQLGGSTSAAQVQGVGYMRAGAMRSSNKRTATRS